METTITLSLPEEIAIQLAANGEDLSRMALEAFALQEYRACKLSTAQLQRVLGFETRVEVDGFLKKHGVELEYTYADLERDREAHRQLGLQMGIVADTGPLNYLAWIEAIEILPNLYGQVLIPPAVWKELSHPKTPPIVRDWLASSPAWLIVADLKQPIDPALAYLGCGEQEAITLALGQRAGLLLIDERDGTRAASRRGLTVTGTLGVLDQAAVRGWVDLPTAFAKLEQTSFRCPRALMASLVTEDKQRKKT